MTSVSTSIPSISRLDDRLFKLKCMVDSVQAAIDLKLDSTISNDRRDYLISVYSVLNPFAAISYLAAQQEFPAEHYESLISLRNVYEWIDKVLPKINIQVKELQNLSVEYEAYRKKHPNYEVDVPVVSLEGWCADFESAAEDLNDFLS